MAGPNVAQNLAAIKQRQQAVWTAGDYSAIGGILAPTAEVLVEDVDISAGQSVLDVACGSGNVAIAAARRHAHVVGIDYVPVSLARARERAAAERFVIDFKVADAEALPFPDASFDVVLSAFGVMFAPDQEKAASELLRVCRPGGRIGLANWTPIGAAVEFFKRSAKYLPPSPPIHTPWEWGDAGRLTELFAAGSRSIRMQDRIWLLKAETPDAFLAFYRKHFGPFVELFPTLTPEQAEEFSEAMWEVVRDYNRATDGTISSAFSYVTVVIER
jgi:ubiquinone/menaquinone biosynthesis C-methylase UbiE